MEWLPPQSCVLIFFSIHLFACSFISFFWRAGCLFFFFSRYASNNFFSSFIILVLGLCENRYRKEKTANFGSSLFDTNSFLDEFLFLPNFGYYQKFFGFFIES